MFKIGDYIVHPMHGAGIVDGIVTKKINGSMRDYYVLKLPVGDMLLMVPVDGCEDIGVRNIISYDEAENVFSVFSSLEFSQTQNWNKRYRENVEKIKSGNVLDVASVVKGLMCRENERGLSTGERKMLHSAKQILISALVIATDSSYEDVEKRLYSALEGR